MFSHDHAEVPERKICGSFFKKHNRHEQVQLLDMTHVFFGLLARFSGTESRAHPGANTFPPETDFFVESRSSGPSASRNTFSVSTIKDGNARGGGRSSYPPSRRPDCTSSRFPCGGVRPAGDPVDSDPGAVFEDDPLPRSDAGRSSLECVATHSKIVISRGLIGWCWGSFCPLLSLAFHSSRLPRLFDPSFFSLKNLEFSWKMVKCMKK